MFIFFILDMSKLEVLKDFVVELFENWQIDIFVNNVGIIYWEKVEYFVEENWYYVLNVNLNSLFILIQLVGSDMLKRGYGKIINIVFFLFF